MTAEECWGTLVDPKKMHPAIQSDDRGCLLLFGCGSRTKQSRRFGRCSWSGELRREVILGGFQEKALGTSTLNLIWLDKTSRRYEAKSSLQAVRNLGISQ